MLRRIKENEFDEYIEFAYELNINPATSSYPIHYDGINTKEDFIKGEKESLEDESSEILLFIMDDQVMGWINYFFIEEDNYLQVSTCSVKNYISVLAKELVDYFNEKFKGYEYFIGFPEENKDAIECFMNNGFKINEESYNTNIVDLKDITTNEKDNNTFLITKDNYSLFEALHKETEEEMYWTSKRIYNDLGRWIIFVYVIDSIPKGTVYASTIGNTCEIFGLNFINEFDENVFNPLLNNLFIECKCKNIKSIHFFTDDKELTCALKVGFRKIGKYIGLKK